MSEEVDEDQTWIRMVKHRGDHWPYYTHPCYPDDELDLKGAFRVRWSDGTVTIEEVKTKTVSTMAIRGAESVTGTFQYFERRYNDMDLIHELHEIELLESEVTRCVISPSHAVCANA